MTLNHNYIELSTADAQLNPSSGKLMIMDMQGRRIYLSWSDFKAVTALYREAGADVPEITCDAPEGWL